MDDKMSGMGLIIVLLILFGLFGLGRGSNAAPANPILPTVLGPSNCEIEKQSIIDAARTQYLIGDTARVTQEAAQAQFTALGNKIDYYAYENLKDQLAQERNKNMVLESKLYSDGKFNALGTQIAELACNVTKNPPFYVSGVYPTPKALV